jgi:hypothetical protein
VIGVWPTARAYGLPTRDANYTMVLMPTGLTFGTIVGLYGLTNGYIDQPTFTILVAHDLDAGYVLWATSRLVDVDKLPAGGLVVRIDLVDRPRDRFWMRVRRP